MKTPRSGTTVPKVLPRRDDLAKAIVANFR
jgi:hypothetical protein